MLKMHTATSLNVLFDYDFIHPAAEQLKRTNAGGFKYIDMNFWDWGHSPKSPLMNDGWEDWVKGIGEKGAELGVTFHQAHAMVYNPFVDDPLNESRIIAAQRSVIGAGILGVDWVVFHAIDTDDKDDETKLRRNMEWLKPYVELAGKHNTGIALENFSDGGKHSRYCTVTEHLPVLVDSFKADNVGICWDIGHAHCNKLEQYPEIMKLGKRLKVLHVQDNNGLSDQHTAPYYGTVNWNEVKRALVDVGYEGEFTFEAHMLVRSVPEDCKNDAIKLLYSIGEHIVNM